MTIIENIEYTQPPYLFDGDRVCRTGTSIGSCIWRHNLKVNKVHSVEANVRADGLYCVGVGASSIEGSTVAWAPKERRLIKDATLLFYHLPHISNVSSHCY